MVAGLVIPLIQNFIQVRYGHNNKYLWAHIIIILLLLTSIIVLTFIGALDKSTVGTLLGSIIGYSLGKFSQSAGNHGGK